MRTHRLLSLAAVLALLVGCATQPTQTGHGQQSLERGRNAWLVGDFENALPDIQAAALSGNARAQYALGYMFYNGQGVARDLDKALRWIRRAADQGDPLAVEALSRIAGSFTNPENRKTAAPDKQPTAPAQPPPTSPPGAASPDSDSDAGKPQSGTPDGAGSAAETAPATGAAEEPTTMESETDHWLTRRDPSHYTVQLLAARDRGTVDRFLGNTQPPGDVHVVDAVNNGNHWLVVVMGDYPSAHEARQAIEELPTPLRESRPYPRRFSSRGTP